MTTSILVTGASGFVGRALVTRLNEGGYGSITAASRRPVELSLPGVRHIAAGNLSSEADWVPALAGIHTVVHTAARVHIMNGDSAPEQFQSVNVAGTERLARQASEAGVRRFVFLSSIKVNGEATPPGQPYTPDQPPCPVDDYGKSKRDAEEALKDISRTTGMEVVIIRPPLVYGPGVKANFLSMMRWIHRGIPLPLGSVDNRRSFVFIDNLCNLIQRCIEHPDAAGQTFLVSDDHDLSTAQLLRRMGDALGQPARLLPVPPALIQMLATMLGRRATAERLLGNLQVDIGKTKGTLDWTPPVDIGDAFAVTAKSFLGQAA